MMNREEALQAIQTHLAQLDDETLVRLAQALSEGNTRPMTRGQQAALSRRGFLKGILVMGLMGSLTTTGGTYLGWQSGNLAGRTAAELRLSLEIARLRGLLALYEALEAVGIDRVVEEVLTLGSGLLHTFDDGLARMGSGINLVEQGLARLEDWLGNLEDGVAWVKERFAHARDLFRQLLDLVEPLLEPAARAGNLMLALADRILGWVPDWARAPFAPVFDLLGSLVEQVPETIEGTMSRLITPVERTLLARGDGQDNLHAWLIRPLRDHILVPWQEQVRAWQDVLAHWETDIIQPLQDAIERRREIRAQIAAYREAMGNGTTTGDV